MQKDVYPKWLITLDGQRKMDYKDFILKISAHSVQYFKSSCPDKISGCWKSAEHDVVFNWFHMAK